MLRTEMRNPNTMNIDKMNTFDMLKTINDENKRVPLVVEAALPEIEKTVEYAAKAIESGGRIIYIGAGTSGRLCVIDAAECPPTFGVDEDTFVAIIAGGEACMMKASEDEEDSADNGCRNVAHIGITSKDILIGVSASGGAAYVIGAMEKAKAIGCKVIAVTNNKGCPIDLLADISIVADTGAEAITGSTRLKAGTAQKLILNLISTGTMIKTGKVYENLMINVKPSNAKLLQRCIRIICEITGAVPDRAEEELNKAGGSIRKAVESIKRRDL